MENQVRKYKNWDELAEKTVAAEAKAALRPASYIRKWISIVPGVIVRPAKTQGSSMKDPRIEKSKEKNLGSGRSGSGSGSSPQRTEAEPFKKKRKKKNRGPYCGSRWGSQGSGGTPTTRVYKAQKDLSHITCFNCNQKGHYATKCPKPRKSYNASSSDASSSDSPDPNASSSEASGLEN